MGFLDARDASAGACGTTLVVCSLRCVPAGRARSAARRSGAPPRLQADEARPAQRRSRPERCFARSLGLLASRSGRPARAPPSRDGAGGCRRREPPSRRRRRSPEARASPGAGPGSGSGTSAGRARYARARRRRTATREAIVPDGRSPTSSSSSSWPTVRGRSSDHGLSRLSPRPRQPLSSRASSESCRSRWRTARRLRPRSWSSPMRRSRSTCRSS